MLFRSLSKDAEMPRDPGGRPMIELDPEEVKSLAKFGPTREEMMAHFKVSGTVLDRYRKEIEEGRELGRLLIRKRARILAMEGNVPMLLHACKHALGERDSGGTTNIAIMGPGQVPQGGPVEIKDADFLNFQEISNRAMDRWKSQGIVRGSKSS